MGPRWEYSAIIMGGVWDEPGSIYGGSIHESDKSLCICLNIKWRIMLEIAPGTSDQMLYELPDRLLIEKCNSSFIQNIFLKESEKSLQVLNVFLEVPDKSSLVLQKTLNKQISI